MQLLSHIDKPGAAALKEFHSVTVFVGIKRSCPSLGVITDLQSPPREVVSINVLVLEFPRYPSERILIAYAHPAIIHEKTKKTPVLKKMECPEKCFIIFYF